MRSYIRVVGTNAIYNEGDEFVAGQSMMFSGPVDKVPAGWLVEDGSAISRTAYATLFAAIGTMHGPGDGVNTFNLPDSRGEFWRGLDLGAGRDAGRVLGSKQGDAGRNLTGELGTTFGNTAASGAVVAGTKFSEIGDVTTAGPYAYQARSLDASRQWGAAAANEFRGRNLSKIPIIKYS